MSAPGSAREHPQEWEEGKAVKDTSTGRVGRVMGHEGPRYQLRPLNGGREWEAEPAALVLATPSEVLSARVAIANKRWGA